MVAINSSDYLYVISGLR